jgi:hypothetical protein
MDGILASEPPGNLPWFAQWGAGGLGYVVPKLAPVLGVAGFALLNIEILDAFGECSGITCVSQ